MSKIMVKQTHLRNYKVTQPGGKAIHIQAKDMAVAGNSVIFFGFEGQVLGIVPNTSFITLVVKADQ